MMRTLAIMVLLAAAGCTGAPATGTVRGMITLDGAPVPGGLIRFVPIDGQGQPEDCVIQDGRYTVTTGPGQMRVEIFWLKEEVPGGGKPDTATPLAAIQQTQMIPERYNTQSTLTYTLAAGQQEKDFALTAK
jgi:hypothetical protein